MKEGLNDEELMFIDRAVKEVTTGAKKLGREVEDSSITVYALGGNSSTIRVDIKINK